MVVSLLFGKKYARAQVGAVFLDAVVQEDHSYNNRVSNFPIEDGTFISDHVITEPLTVRISGIVSDTPLNIFAGFNRSVDSFNRLVRIVENKEIITVVTGIKVYTQMVITSLNVPRNIETGQSLTFNIELQKLIIDDTTRLNLVANGPFQKGIDRIPRQTVAESTNYPFLQNDPSTSLKDQASSGIDVGIQALRPIPEIIQARVLETALLLKGVA